MEHAGAETDVGTVGLKPSGLPERNKPRALLLSCACRIIGVKSKTVTLFLSPFSVQTLITLVLLAGHKFRQLRPKLRFSFKILALDNDR